MRGGRPPLLSLSALRFNKDGLVFALGPSDDDDVDNDVNKCG